MNPSQRLDPKTARDELTDHPYYRYRGCAPDPDNPKVAAGNPALPVTAWEAPDLDGGEPQQERIAREQAAIDVCVSCPVMVACLAYGSSVTREGRLAEPHSILGGMTALERHRQFVRARQQAPVRPKPAPVHQLRTAQKLAVLEALARHRDPHRVAAAVGMDERTANWQLSSLVGKLGLGRDATRMQLLDAAAARGLLDGVRVVADDGTVPAIPQSTAPMQLTINLWAGQSGPCVGRRRMAGRRSRHASSPVRLRLVAWTVQPLPFPSSPALQETAAA